MATAPAIRRVVGRREARLLAAITLAELLLLGLYLAATPARVTRLRYALYPFVWINVGIWAVLRVDPPSAPRSRRLAAGALAALYLLVLLWLTGLIGLDPGGNPAELVGLSIGYGTPGWERVRLVLPAAHLTLVPFRVVGALALSYLVYVTALEAARAAVTGVVGFASCLSCAFPLLASISGLFGGSAALYAYSLDVSTGVFLLTVALLVYRPWVSAAAQRIE